jgi:hypothetical protein
MKDAETKITEKHSMKVMYALALILGTATAASAQFNGTVGQPQYRSGIGQPQYGIGSNQNDHYVRPYFNQNGTEVQGHWQTNPNPTPYDNYSYRGNVNPHNGAVGTRY